jgi:biotin carboxyl carrier protein
MKKISYWILALGLILGCEQQAAEEQAPPPPKPLVQVTQVHLGSVSDNLELFASTLYLKRNIVAAPIPAYITSVKIRLGQSVVKGQLLYELESKEHRALGDVVIAQDSSLAGFGRMQVRAPISGVVTTFDKQQPGDYVLEGTQLCTVAESSDLAFQVNVPYEYTSFVHIGTHVTLQITDSIQYDAVITTPLTAMNIAAQTQMMLARTSAGLYLPENLIVKVIAKKESSGQHQILPKSSVQCDEMMEEFWVFKMVNDTTAIKVPVTIGNKSVTEIEVLSPQFLLSDRIVTVGGYGLPDTTIVNIERHE